jgi:periplasmic divalent cation tolerance protein
MSDPLQVITVAANRDEAQRIAEKLIENHLAACVQVVGPIVSTYRWQGKIEHGDEWLCLVKTTFDRYAEVESTIRSLHSYEVPEIIATPIVAGSADYLNWLRQEVKQKP